jgi:hypothetical protein
MKFWRRLTPATLKGYSAPEDTDASSRAIAHGEEEVIARFLDKTDRLLAAVIAALVLCVGFIAFGRDAHAATQVQRMQHSGQQSTEYEPCQPGTSNTTIRG